MRTVEGREVHDTLEELVDPAHTAVIAVDIQNDFCHPEGHFGRNGKNLSAVIERLPAMVRFIRDAQALGLPIVFIRQTTLPGGRSDSPAWLRFKTRDGKTPDYTVPDSWGWEFVDGLAVTARDATVVKHRPDAFHGTSLDLLLRARGIETCIVLGTTTEGCVESTIRAASYHDYYVVVVRDAVASPNPVLHEGSMRLFEARYPLHSSEEILRAVRAGAGTEAAA